MKQFYAPKKILYLIPALLLLSGAIWLEHSLETMADTELSADAENMVTESTITENTVTDYAVSFSVPSGFYEEDFFLTLTAPSGFSVYYTLDGTTPDSSSNLYTGPLLVTNMSSAEKKFSNRTDFNPGGNSVASADSDNAYIIRAIGIDSKGVSTEVATATYFVGLENTYEDKAVISIVTDPDNLFDPETGIYVLGNSYQQFVENGGDPSNDLFSNYFQTGRAWERPAHIDYFDIDKNYIFSQETGIRINGNSSRSDSLKSLRLYARKEYDGNRLFTYSFFEDGIYLNSIILRRGVFENQFLPSLVSDRNFCTQKYILCAAFIDGEYWGNYYLQERYDAEYIEGHYHIDADNVTIIKDGALFSGSAASADSYQQLLNFMTENDLSISENYDYVCEQLDIQSYIDYYCTQIYINNYDFSESKNSVLWRADKTDAANPYADGRWRFALMDVDLSLTAYGDIENYRTNTFNDSYALTIQSDEIMMRALLANPDFRQQFVTTFLDLENQNFRYETVCEKAEEYEELFYYPDIIKEYFQKRPAYINGHLAATFGLTGTLTDVALSVNDASAGAILLGTITPDLTNGTWYGSYYNDYPIHVTALPQTGYHFKNWVVNDEVFSDEELTIPLDEPVTISAVFEED